MIHFLTNKHFDDRSKIFMIDKTSVKNENFSASVKKYTFAFPDLMAGVGGGEGALKTSMKEKKSNRFDFSMISLLFEEKKEGTRIWKSKSIIFVWPLYH